VKAETGRSASLRQLLNGLSVEILLIGLRVNHSPPARCPQPGTVADCSARSGPFAGRCGRKRTAEAVLQDIMLWLVTELCRCVSMVWRAGQAAVVGEQRTAANRRR
jgi:hypothetical protein